MKHVYLGILFICSAIIVKAQQLTVNKIIDKNLTVTFPAPIDSSVSGQSVIYNSTAGKVQFSVSKLVSTVVDRSKDEFDSSMNTFRQLTDTIAGALYNKRFFLDTVIGGTKGVYVIFDSLVTKLGIDKVYIFYTTKDSFTYTLSAKLNGIEDEDTRNRVNAFYSNLVFSENYYETLPLTIYGVPPKKLAGRIFGIIAVLIFLSYLIYSQTKRKTVI